MEPRCLAIQHVEASSPPSFQLTRLQDGKLVTAVTLTSPYTAPIEGRPDSNLIRELRWYLEQFLDYPFHPETLRAEHVLNALQAWGTEAFNALFDRRDASEWLSKTDTLQIRSDNPNVLSWPWEALFDPRAGSYVAHRYRIERRLNQLSDPPPLPDLPTGRINILLVVARPYAEDVRYRSIARPLVELIREKNLPAHVDVLRPPTFDQLREHLRANPGFYHVLHFDGHGAYGANGGEYSPHQFRARQGCLVFENKQGEPDEKSAADLSTLLHEYAVPAVVLNACQSASLDDKTEDTFATVATALLRGGMRSVVAMAYSLYVSGAQVFLPAFYGRLFEKGSVAEAVRAGRQEMLAHKERISARGPFELQDWLLPVLYQQAPIDFTFASEANKQEPTTRLPQEVLEKRDDYGFIGRDSAILKMERALHRQAPCILVQGLGGVGKTTLARGFLRWLDETGGLEGAQWLDFREIHTAEYVVNRTGELFYGEHFHVAQNKLDLLSCALKDYRIVLVWDNFESAAQNLTDEDRAELGHLLDAIHGTRAKVIITSRATEEWLGPSRRFELRLGGLDGEERWEYCDAILRELGVKVNRNDPELAKLMDQLAGHPLAMRVVLPKLEHMSAAKVGEVLRSNIADLGLNEQEEQGRLFATLHFVEQDLSEDLRPLMSLVGLHEAYVDTNFLEAMAKGIDPAWTRQRIDQLMTALCDAGLMKDIGQATYEMHPLLTSYLRSQNNAGSELQQRAFVGVMSSLANDLARRQLHEQRIPFFIHRANFHFARSLADRLAMDNDFSALTYSLARYTQNLRHFDDASRLFDYLAKHAATHRNWEQESMFYHQLGIIAQEQREFARAREWYLKSLAISEKQENEYGTASTYHQLGRIAEDARDFAGAREWYLKSVAISEKQGNEHEAASTYHQLGVVAQREREFAGARSWYVKSLAINEKQGNGHGAALTYGQFGILEAMQGHLPESARWLARAIHTFAQISAAYEAQVGIQNLLIAYNQASPEDKLKIEAIWAESGLGPFPTQPNP